MPLAALSLLVGWLHFIAVTLPTSGLANSLVQMNSTAAAAPWGGVSPDSRSLASCGTLANAGTTSVLQNDVSSPGTCFSILADNITLNLNGHTITYATSPQTIPTFGIVGQACWDAAYRAPNPCGDHSDHFTLAGPGTIMQGSGAAPYSHGIRIGETNDGDYLTVHDVIFNISSTSSIPIYTNFAGAGSVIYNNTIHNNVTVINSRSTLEGMSIKIDNTQNSSPGQTVYNNTIIGGAQGGIFLISPGAKVYGNTISQAGTYANDFAIYLWGNNESAYNNTIQPTLGRGIQLAGGATNVNGNGVGGSGSVARDNKITVVEQADNIEYGGCQLGGAYGVQFDDNPKGDTANNNTVVARADQCMAQALRVTDSRTPLDLSHNNTYIAQRVGSSSAIASGWALAGPTGFTSRNDTFIADTANVYFDWEGAGNITCISCTFVKGSNPAPNYVTLSFQNGGAPVSNVHFIDSAFQNGAAKDRTDMVAIGTNGWHQAAEYFIDWTYTLTVKDGLGNNASEATVVITDGLGKQVFSGTTGVNGQISTVLNEFHMFNTSSGVTREMHTPHTVSVSKMGCIPLSHPVTITRTTAQKAELACQ